MKVIQYYSGTCLIRIINYKLLALLLATYNYFHNILRRLDVLTNFPFTASETIRDYYLETCYIPVSSRIADGIFAAGGAFVPAQEKKKKKDLGS